VISEPAAAAILQLGAPAGYRPLRRYLLDHAAQEGIARPTDDVIVTNGVQQALDLIQRVICGGSGGPVVVEDPVYPGLKNIFSTAGTRVIGVPCGNDGIDLDALARVLLRERPRLLVLTPNFQNPTGSTLPLEARRHVIRMVREAQVVLVENDIYGALRYRGDPLPTLKELDDSGDVVLLRSFSKLAFPGLRVGWVIAPKPLTARLAEAKQCCDLHTDQLSQAVLLRFAESGRLSEHRTHVLHTGLERLECALSTCQRVMPDGAAYTKPEGGMNLWIRLPEQLDSGELLGPAQREGVAYLPGKYFAVSRDQSSCLRISFAGLEPDKIRHGLDILGKLFRSETSRVRTARTYEPATALV
jgi:2-aminoadipate transaminase